MSDQLKELGRQAFVKQEYKKAAKIYRDAIKIDPTSPVLYSNRAMCFVKMEDWQRALDDCKKGLSHNPEPKLRVKLLWRFGLSTLQLGFPEEARKRYAEALEIDPGNTTVLDALKDLERDTPSKRGSSPSNSSSSDEKRSKNTSVVSSVGGRVELVIKEVDTLPEEFRSADTPRSQKPIIALEETPGVSHSGITVSEETPLSAHSGVTVLEAHSLGSEFPATPTVYFLQSLNKIPEHQRQKAYEYVLSIPPEVYRGLFSVGGIDSDFIDFSLSAILDPTTIERVSNAEHRALGLLQTMAQCKRFELSASFCSSEKIGRVLEAIRKSEDTLAGTVLQTWREFSS